MSKDFVRTTTINKILKLKKRIKGCQGGTSSGKTFGILPILVNKALSKEFTEISVVAESVPHLRRGVIKDFKKIMVATNRWKRPQWHSTTSTYTFQNGSTIEFFSADDDSKLRGARRDVLYINEANNISFEAYQELAVRTKKDVYLDWNPTSEFWFHEHIQQDDDVDFVILTYLDNEACPQSAIDYILKAKEKGKKSTYWANWYKVYGLGLVGSLEGTVFENWEIGEFDESLVYCFGMDFGWSPSPTTLVKVGIDYKQKIIYVQEKFNAIKQTSEDIVNVCNQFVPANDLIVCDYSDNSKINDLRANRINAIPCDKGADSVRLGVKRMLDYKIIVTPESNNIQRELRKYIWNDKKAGIPLKNEDHCFVGETLVLTDKGNKRIDEVDVGDMVANSFGFNEVLHVWDNGIKKTSLYLMQFDTFSVSLECTPNHLIKTTDGWEEIQYLTEKHIIYLNKNLMEGHTICTKEKNTMPVVIGGCTETYGRFIMDQYPRAITYTTLMPINQITGLKTLSYLMGESIFLMKVKRELKKTLNGLKSSTLKVLKRLKTGISQKRVETGISNTAKTVGRTGSTERLIVKSAVKNTKQDTEVFPSTAITTAKLVRIEEKEKNLKRVYDLMVMDNHEYTANGVVVHNCVDSIRYAFEYLNKIKK